MYYLLLISDENNEDLVDFLGPEEMSSALTPLVHISAAIDEPVAGIAVIKHFETATQPLRVIMLPIFQYFYVCL
jgi:hypothetical protein